MQRRTTLTTASLAFALAAGVALSGCASSSPSGTGDGDEPVRVSLIVKAASMPFFVAMEEAAEEAAAEHGVELTVAAGRSNGDEDGQIQAIENAISRGDDGILIAPNGPAVIDAIQRARDAGLYVIAVDEPVDGVDVSYATDNFAAGELIGQWSAGTLDGEAATIGLIDAFDDRILPTDVDRNQGFLSGMGIELGDDGIMGDEPATGAYSGGDYTIVGNEASQATEDGGRTAMENLMSKNADINLVYAINEPAAYGAFQALKAAGRDGDVLLVTVDGGCAGVQQVQDGALSATSQQYPSNMAVMGIEAIIAFAESGAEPEVPAELGFIDTGVALVTDHPVDAVGSIDSAEGAELCWG